MALYPIFLKLDGLKCLVIGGGKVALRKIVDLLDAGAKVTVVAPVFVDEIKELASKIELVERDFKRFDLEGMSIVVAATDSEHVNRLAHSEAKNRGIWINVVDSPELCDFFLPARTKIKGVEVAVSTLGKSPLAARLIRDLIRGAIKEEHLKLMEILSDIRKYLHSQVDDPKKREEFWEKFGASPLLEWAEKEQWDRIWEEAKSCGLRLQG